MAPSLVLALAMILPLPGAENPPAASQATGPVSKLVLPAGKKITKVEAFPSLLKLHGLDDRAQVLLTGTLDDGSLVDLTHHASLSIDKNSTLKALPGNRVQPLSNGTATVTLTHGGLKASVPVEVQSCEAPLPINFTNQIIPIFTKMSCNGGGCHGKSGGQNGFRLSLLGFEPEIDYVSLAREERNRRILVTAPDNSLFLTKGTGQVAHGGGRKMEVDSDEYRLVRRWIATGMPWGKPGDPTLVDVTVHPANRVMRAGNTQQIVVLARYSDGRTEDITRRAQYESNATDIATVDGGALVRAGESSGEATVMVRYQDRVATFRATVPLSKPSPPWEFVAKTLVDTHTAAKWRELGLAPSANTTDEIFLRRASLDLTGSLPTAEAVRQFVADKDPAKRDKLIDRLVDSPEYAYFFAGKWADILKVKRGGDGNRATGTFAFHAWLRDAMANDMPYNEFARAVLAGTGDESTHPPVFWTLHQPGVEQFVDDTAQVFMGLRLTCAQCHHHPYEKWSQDDYWGLANFFSRVGKKDIPLGANAANQEKKRTMVVANPSGNVNNKRNNQPAPFKALDTPPVTIEPGDDPRQALSDWLTADKNPFFAKAIANRMWAHFFNRGLVDPMDDMRLTNPPSNPALLDALAKDFVANKYSIKHLVKTMVKSRTYQLSAEPNDFNQNDKQNHARYYPRRQPAEVLYDAICQVTGAPSAFGGLPTDQKSPRRATMLPDESFSTYFLDVFGKPQRISACECERGGDANLAQALHLLNSDEIQNMLTRAGGRADLLAKDKRPDGELLDELFLCTVGRLPTAEQKKTALEHLVKHKDNRKVAFENILWALVNTREFLFVQ